MVMMKWKKLWNYLLVITILLIVIFLFIVGIDYYNYDTLNNSAPFYTYIIVRSLEFILPSIILFLISLWIKKNY